MQGGVALNSSNKNSVANVMLLFMLLPNIIVLFSSQLFNLYSNYSIIINLFYVVILIILSPKNYKYSEVLFLVFVMAFLFLNALLNTKAYGSALILFEVFLVIMALSKIRLEKRFMGLLLWFMIALNFFLFIKSVSFSRTGFSNFNTNQLAMNSFVSFMYVVILNSRLFKKNFLVYFSGIFTVLAILNYDSRTTFFSLLFFLLLAFIVPKRILMRKVYYRLIYRSIIAMGILIPLGYVLIWLNRFTIGIEFMGKRLFTGRELMWVELYASMRSLKDLLFGVGSRGVFTNELANAHNITLHIIMVSGLISCIIYYVVLINKFEILVKNNFEISRLGFQSLIAFWSMIVYGLFENPIQPNRMILIFLFLAIYIDETTCNGNIIDKENVMTAPRRL